jgi:16S rRNA (adenine1518-N6/adenine1519-N6)-dimethyltransferase
MEGGCKVDVTSVTELRSLLAGHCVAPLKRWGQNFLIDGNISRAIITLIDPGPEDTILEIGPGAGALTLPLARAGCRLLAVERDLRLKPVLEQVLEGQAQVRFIWSDIMEVDVPALGPNKIVGNLPYYLTSPLLFRLLKPGLTADRLVFMVQDEVADRIVAAPGTKAYGALSVVCAYRTNPRRAIRVAPSAFWPQPEVHSAVVAMERKPAPATVDERLLFAIIEAAFAHRRKTLANCLRFLRLDPHLTGRALAAAGINPVRRGETLSVEEFMALSSAIEAVSPGAALRGQGGEC